MIEYIPEGTRCIVGFTKDNKQTILFCVKPITSTKAQTLDFIIWLDIPTENERMCLYPVLCKSGKWYETRMD